MKKLVVGGIAALSIVTGSAAVAALSPLTSAGAQSTTGSTATTSTATGNATTAPARVNPLKSVLDGLVTDGTITQAQADAITAKGQVPLIPVSWNGLVTACQATDVPLPPIIAA